jgi:O-antigen/teichoic acid export membrane protein
MPTLARETTRHRAASDIAMQIAVRVGNLAIGAVVTALVVRTLGQTAYGEWSTSFVALVLVAYFANFGMQGVALREASRDPEHEHEWIGAVMYLRLLVVVPVMLVALAVVFVLHRSNQMLIAGGILVVAMPFDGVGALGLLFQLRVDNRVPMFVLTLRSILWGAAVLVVYLEHSGMIALSIAMASTNAVGGIVQVLAALKLDVRLPRPSRKRLAEVVQVGMPIGIAGVLVIAYARIDQIIVFVVAGSGPAGLYSAVYNLIDQAHFVPISVLTTLTPVLAAAWPADPARMLRTARLTAELLTITSMGGLAFTIAAATPAVRLIFGQQFVAAAPALPLLAGAFVFICFGYLNSNLLVVLGLQRRFMRISLIALAVNLVGNFILVPLVGFVGAAAMTLVTEVVVCGASLQLILRTLERPLPKAGRLGRTVLAGAVLTGVLELLRVADASLAVLVLVTCVAYPALLFLLRALGREDLRILLRRGVPA